MDYTVIQPNSELRSYARQQLKGVWGKAIFAYFIYFLILLPYYIVSGLNQVASNELTMGLLPSFPTLGTILYIAVIVVAGPFAVGWVSFFIRRVRGEEFVTQNIFEGFQRFLPSFLTMFFTFLFTFLWTLLLIVPGIIKIFAYSQAYYILYDNPGMKPREAIKQSQIMMKGYKGKLFLLELSFFGWALLCVLTLGIGYFWLYPYMGLSLANFYENLKTNQGSAAATTTPAEAGQPA